MNCRTGDLILFSGSSWFSKFIEYFTNSNVSHVGIIVENPPMDIIQLYNLDKKETTFLFESVINLETNEYGVNLIPLRQRIKKYDGEVYIRFIENLHASNEELMRIIRPELETEYKHGYDYNPLHFLECYAFNELTGLSKYLADIMSDPRRTDRVFCSALVAYCYSIMGLIKDDIKWSYIEPEYFESLNNLEMGAGLSKPFRIIDDSQNSVDQYHFSHGNYLDIKKARYYHDTVNPKTKSLSILCGDNLYQ